MQQAHPIQEKSMLRADKAPLKSPLYAPLPKDKKEREIVAMQAVQKST